MEINTLVYTALIGGGFLNILGLMWYTTSKVIAILGKIKLDQSTTMQFLLRQSQGKIAAPSGSAGGNGTGKPESEILTAVGILLDDELENHSVVTTFKPGSKEFVRIIDLDTWDKVVNSLKAGVMPARSVQAQPEPVPGPVAADPAAVVPAQKTKRHSNPKAIEALKAFNLKRQEAAKNKNQTPAPVLFPVDQAAKP